MNCADLKRLIQPKDERCCDPDADVHTESSDCESCKSVVIPEIPESEESSAPFVIRQCIWNPEKEVEGPIEEPPKAKPVPKKKKLKQKRSQISLVEPFNYNISELEEFITLPLHDKEIAELIFGEILLISFLNIVNPLKCSDDLFNFKNNKYATIGGFCINIQRDGRNIIVYSASEFSCNGKATRGSIYSLCDSYLNLIEEKRTELYINENGDKQEKSIHLIRESVDGTDENKRLIAFRTENENKLISKYHTKIKINVSGPLIPDGLNFVLLRHLAVIQYVGSFDTWTINIKGVICRSEYIFKPIKVYKINSVNTEVIEVIRNITSLNDKPQIIKMFYLTTGHMIRHEWEYYPFVIHINPLGSVPPSGFILNSFETWQQQIELVSNYLDCKDQTQSKLKTYLNDKPEVKCMIKDYISLLLQLKPANILELTVEYFMNLNGDVQTAVEEEDVESESDSFFNSNLGSSDDEYDEKYTDDDEKYDDENYS